MVGEDIVGMVIMLACSWGSAGLFFAIGVWANWRERPMHFWAGTEIDPKTVSDIPAYNHENAVMWKVYSVPYWVAGGLNLFQGWSDWFAIGSLVILVLACFPGLMILIRHYQRIEDKYICR